MTCHSCKRDAGRCSGAGGDQGTTCGLSEAQNGIMHPIIEARSATLLDMLKLLASQFLRELDNIERLVSHYMHLATEKTINPEELPTKHNLRHMAGVVRTAAELCESLGLSKESADDLISHLEGEFPPSYRNAITGLQELRAEIAGQLKRRTVLIVDPLRNDYFDQDNLFGVKVSAAFHKTKDEIRRAGTAYALEDPDACMFHLMRVLEHGLLALAKRVIHQKPKTLTLKTWGKIIVAIDTQLSTQSKVRTPRSATRTMQYAAIAKDYGYLKNAWRDVVMHGKADFTDAGAHQTLTYVRGFMQNIVAMGIKE